MAKTVYLLGTGFSVPAGAPIQSKFLKEVWKMADGTRQGQQQSQKEVKFADAARDLKAFIT